uniref:EGF-like domain-containing protein n=1 Tax=Plectus sambesii TaxID=2011161 RepID=A0A914WDJ9_9BILA
MFCDCPSPFTGRYCEDVACVNGLATGAQYDSESRFFNKRCLCDPGWIGDLCDKSLINRCGDNGKEDKGKCICQSNFVGDRCEYVTKCTHGQLYNGRCACHYGWAGDFCDKIICHQGSPNETNTGCLCPSKYRGKYCDFCAEPSSSPPPECARL